MRSYDAIGLMRQLSENTSATISNAWDVMTNNDPEIPSKTFCSSDKNLSDQEKCFHSEQENMPPGVLVSDISIECCVCVSGAFIFHQHFFCSFGPDLLVYMSFPLEFQLMYVGLILVDISHITRCYLNHNCRPPL
jgi:hypothetical protein